MPRPSSAPPRPSRPGLPDHRSCATPATKTDTSQVGAVKQKISDERGWEPKHQKLIYSGRSQIANRI